MTQTIESTRFKRVGGIWIPVELRTSRQRRLPEGRKTMADSHISVTEFVVDPDQDALDGFVPNDILDGASARLFGPEGQQISTRHTGSGGGFVPEADASKSKVRKIRATNARAPAGRRFNSRRTSEKFMQKNHFFC